ncbi:MAG: hypothetical protein IT316_00325 [Anaerolineales bacterium]|nr:hypothetical protein [Anaerolineales bacterium]
MKLLSLLKKQPADNCVILTYNADLPFFEYTVFEPIYASGCRNTLVICDSAQYNQSIEDSSLLRYAGQRYLILPARISKKAFHPKLILLTGKDSGHLLIASSNLTKAGYAYNWEVATHFEYKASKPDEGVWQVFHWAVETIQQILNASDTTGLGVQRFDQILGTTPWLRQEHDPRLPKAVWPIHNLETPIFRQVVEEYRKADNSPVKEAMIISPFFDPGAVAFAELLSMLSPEILKLYTQDPQGLNKHTLKPILARHPTDFQAFHLNADGRRLHAKALKFRTDRGVWMVTGSANFSKPAYLQTASDGNFEMVVLRFLPEPSYFDAWMDELVQDALSLDIDLLPEAQDTGQDKPTDGTNEIRLLSAVLDGTVLTLRPENLSSASGPINIWFENIALFEHFVEDSTIAPDGKIKVELPEAILSELQRPTSIFLRIETAGGLTLLSSKVLLHNRQSLDRFSRPVERRPRPDIPKGLAPDSYEQCALILDMLHELLATNKDLLTKHRPVIRQRGNAENQEKRMAIDEMEEYFPEDHFVKEEIRRPVSSAGEELYADYYDRLTYEEILRAALSAVYHAQSPEEPRIPPPVLVAPDSDQTGVLPAPKEDETKPTNAAAAGTISADEIIRSRIEKGFQRLVRNFGKGLQDEEYLAEVPVRYLLELSLIVLQYLRVVYNDEMLSEKTFTDLSLDLYQSVWGWPGKPGAWASIGAKLSEEEKAYLEEQMVFSARIWFHAYLLAKILDRNKDRRLYDLAAWMRDYTAAAKGPEVLVQQVLPAVNPIQNTVMGEPDQSARVSVAERLKEYSQYYDHISLQNELTSLFDAKNSISLSENIAGISQVPAMKVKMSLVEADLDLFFRTFLKFLNWPDPKQHAWVEFTNTNPPVEEDDIYRVVVFYRKDTKEFSFAAERAVQGKYRPDIWKTCTIADLNQVNHILDLI